MSKERIRVYEDLKNVVEYMSKRSSRITVETKYLKQEDPVVVLRSADSVLPGHVEAVSLPFPHMDVAAVMERERFCWCDGVSTLILYEEDIIPVEEGIGTLSRYIQDVVRGDYSWEEFEEEHLVE